MKFKTIETKLLLEHPENTKYFKDIKATSPDFWIDFKNSIKELGILEPLIVNEKTMEVRQGNQRLKACQELEIETIPVILVDENENENEIQKMVASNVFRRTIDPFRMLEYIGILRNQSQGLNSQAEIAKKIKKKVNFVSAADIFNGLPKEQQEIIEEWFKDKTQGEIVTILKEVNKLKTEKEKDEITQKELEDKIENFLLEKEELENEKKELENEKEELGEEIEKLENEIEQKGEEIEKLEEEKEDLQGEEAIKERDEQIRSLMEDKEKIQKKLDQTEKEKSEFYKRTEINKAFENYIKDFSKMILGLDPILENWNEIKESNKRNFLYNAQLFIESIKNFKKGDNVWSEYKLLK